jgi:glycosyltransferase 2 family protein
VQVLVGFAVSALAIYYLLQQVSIDELRQVLSRAQTLPIVLLVLTVIGSLVTRAARWQVFFLPDRRVRFGPLFGTLAISYMASTFLPLRAGELVRAVFLGRRESVSVPRVVGTILLEKLFDFLAIGVMLGLLIAATPLPVVATVAGATIAGFILIGFGFVVALAVWRAPTLRFLSSVEQRLPFGLGQRLRLEHAARQFAQGTDSLREGRLWVLLLMWTTITWLCAICSTWAGLAAVDLQLGWPALLFLIVLTSTGQAVPSSPGYVGVYHATASFALMAFGVDAASALACAVLIHAFSYATLVVAGLVALWTGGYSFGDMLVSLKARSPAVTTRSAGPWPVAPDP